MMINFNITITNKSEEIKFPSIFYILIAILLYKNTPQITMLFIGSKNTDTKSEVLQK